MLLPIFTLERLEKMKMIAEKNGKHLKTEDGKIVLEDKKDLNLLIQLLSDYFLVSEQTANRYGTYSKRRIA